MFFYRSCIRVLVLSDNLGLAKRLITKIWLDKSVSLDLPPQIQNLDQRASTDYENIGHEVYR